MKTINDYILEKFKMNNNNISKPISNLAKYFGLPEDDAYMLYTKYDNDGQYNINGYFHLNSNELYCTPLEALLMIAFMLVDDGFEAKDYDSLGYKDYNGNNNPYDYSWFEEETRDGDFLDSVKKWIKQNLEEFETIYNIVKKHKDKFDSEKIFNMCENI